LIKLKEDAQKYCAVLTEINLILVLFFLNKKYKEFTNLKKERLKIKSKIFLIFLRYSRVDRYFYSF